MAGQEVQGMLIRLEATTAQLRQEMSRADATVAQVSGRIDSQLGRVDTAFDRVGQSARAAGDMVKTALAGAVSAAGLSELLRHAEAYTTVSNRLKLVTSSAQEFTAAQRAVFDIAQRSGQPLTTTAELYQRIATNQKELKLSGQGVAGIVETIAKTMVISGSSTESANAALIQLGQAFASGVLRGEELNSVMEQAPALAQAIAKGMGVSVGALRSLGAAGQLTADSVVKALQAQATAVNEQFGRMQNTVSTGMTRLDNSATNLIGKFDQATSTSARLSDVLTGMAKTLDSVSADSTSFADTVERVSNVAETLAVVIGARLAVSVGQGAIAFVAATKASIEQTAALVRATVAADAALVADAASAKQAMLTAAARQVDAKALLERANVELATAEQKVAADRMRQASEVGNLQAVQAALVAERALEQQRLRAQITDTGRAQSVARLAELRQSEVLIINQVKAAELVLAETTVATSAEIQAAYKLRAAAAAGYAETALAANQAIALSDKATAAAGATSRSVGAMSAAGSGLLGILTGPVGLIATAGLVALSFFHFGSAADTATQSLIDQHATIDESIKKYGELGAATQRVQRLTWIDQQKEALKEASSALDDYTYKVERGIVFPDADAEKFRAMIDEVKSGKRELSSVTSWIESTIKLYPESEKALAKLTQTYDDSTKKAGDLGKVLGVVTAESDGATKATTGLTAAQQASSGQSAANVAAWDKYYSQLIKTRDLLGANTEAEAAYTAARMGATPAQIAAAKLIGEQTDTLKAYQEAIKQSNEVEKAALKIKLASLYAAEDAQNEAAAAQKKALEDTAKAAEASAGRQVTAMQQVIDQTLRVVNGQNLLLVQPQQHQNLSGASLLTFGGATPTVPVVPKASPDERATAAIAQLDATTEANKRVDKAANAAAAALKAQAKALDDLLAKSGITTQSANDMADAYLSGADNVRAMTIQQKIEEELLKTGAGARDKVTKAINDMQDAEDRRDVAKAAAAMQVEVDQLMAQARATLQGAAAVEAYNVQKAMQTELTGKNISVGSKEYAQLLKQTKAQQDANKALDQANKARDIVDRLNPQIKLLRDYREEQEALGKAMELDADNIGLYQDALKKLGKEYEDNQSKLTIWGKLTDDALNRIDEAFVDMWKNIGHGFSDFKTSLIDSFKQMLAELANAAITKPIMISFINSVTGSNKAGGIGEVLGQIGNNIQSSGNIGISGSAAQGGAGVMLDDAGNIVNYSGTAYSIASSNFGGAVAQGFNSGGFSGAYNGASNYLSESFSGTQGGAGVMLDNSGNIVDGSSLVGKGANYGPYLAAIAGALQGYQNAGVKGAVGGAAGGYAGYQAGAMVGSYFGPIGTAIGAAIGAALGATLGGKLFGTGWVTTQSGLELGVEDNQVSAQQYQYQKKSKALFMGTKRRYKYSDVSDEQQQMLDDAYDTTQQQVIDVVAAIGVAADQGTFAGLDIAKQKISTQGQTDEQIQAAIVAWFDNAADQMVQYLDKGTEGFGYSFKELAQRVNVFTAFNATLDTVNQKTMALSAHNMELANAMVEASGGIEQYTANAAAYSQNFLSATEQADKSIAAVRQQFKNIGIELPETRKAYSDMLEALDLTTETGQEMFVKLTQGATNAANVYQILEQRQQAYYAAFYSSAENGARSLAEITKQFKDAGIVLPATRAGYRAMVDGIDQTTESGKKLYESMIALAGSADTLYTAQEGVVKAQQDLVASVVNNAMSALSKAVSTEKNNLTEAYNARVSSLNDMASTAQSSISELTTTGTALENALKSLNGTSDTTVKMLRAQAKATLQSALATAQGGGSLSGFAGLDDALTAVSSNSTDMYGSLEDFTREQGRTANVVAQLNAINGAQLTTEQQLLKSIQGQISDAKIQFDAQMEILDAQLDTAQKQLDALNGVDNSVLSVADALKAFNASVQAAIAAAAAAAKPVASTGGSYTGGTGSAGAPSYNDINAIYNSVLGRDADAAGAVYWGGQAGSMTAAQLAAAIKADAVANGEIKGYASGGFHSGGLRLVGENGPELEVTGPSRIYNASQTAAMLNGGDDNAALLAEVRELRAENQRGQFQIAKYSQKVAQLLEKFDNEGMPQERDYA
jgi:tape measure domain-containing protein